MSRILATVLLCSLLLLAAAPAVADEVIFLNGDRLTGKVVSTKMQKTIAVLIQRYVPHPQYGQYQRRTTQLLAHDENNTSQKGDVVSITECRPYSKRKAWRLVEIIKRAEVE